MNKRLGHLSPLAVSDVVYITSYYNHIARNYIMVKENGTITTNYLGENTTEEHNGLLVSVPMDRVDVTKAMESLVSLAFFPNIYVDFKTDYSTDHNINDTKIVRYNNFSVCNKLRTSSKYELRRLWVLLGNVLYPLDISKIPNCINADVLDSLKECNICINVNIGEINVTPNRESIIYSENTVNIISDKLKAAVQEIKDNIAKLSSNNIIDLREYYDIVCSKSYWNPIKNCIENSYIGNFRCQVSNPYKGIKRNDDFNNIVKVLECVIPGFKSIRRINGFVSSRSINWTNRNVISCLAKSFIAFEDNRNLTGYAKRYINSKSKFMNIPVIGILKYSEFEREIIIKSQYHSDYYTNTVPNEVIFAIKEAYDYIQNHTKIITIKELNEFKDECKLEEGPKNKFKDNNLYTLFKFTEVSYIYPKSIKVGREIKFDVVIDKLTKAGKVILHNGKTILSTQQADDYLLLESFGYSIYWASNKLFNNIVKYKASLPKGSKILDNVVINYTDILKNPTFKMERDIVLSKFCTDTIREDKYDSRYRDWILGITDMFPNIHLFKDYYEYMSKNKYRLSRITTSQYYKDYQLKSQEAQWLQSYIEYIKKMMNKYYEYYNILENEFSQVRIRKTLAEYFTMKWCIKNKKPFSINRYITIKKNSLIKTLYEQTY